MKSRSSSGKLPKTSSSNIPDELTKMAPRGERLRDKVYLALFVALLSFIGAASGTWVASYFDDVKWKKETSFIIKKEILTKRTELLERTIKSINRLQILDIYNSTSHYSLIEAESLIRSGKVAAVSLGPVADSVVKVKDAQAELSVIMTLDALYFGPKTKNAVSELKKSLESTDLWWHVESAKTQNLIDAIAQELHHELM